MAEKTEICDNCGNLTIKPIYLNSQLYCPKCIENDPDIRKLFTAWKRKVEKIYVTTTNTLDGFKIVEYIGVESFVYVTGTGLYSEFTGGISDLLGRRSKDFENKIQVAQSVALFGLKNKAYDKGADAIIGIDIDFTEFSHNRNGIIVSGTLVNIEKN